MISVSGMPTLTALKLVDATEAKQHELIRNQPQHARAISHFYENIESVESVDDLMADPELFGFVMRAFDLEDQIFGKAMMEKILKSNIEEEDALVNRMADTRFRALYEEMGFGTDGVGNINTILTRWQDRMVERYVDRHFLNANMEENATLGTALDFRRKVADIEGPLDILKDSKMSKFFRTVYGMPSQMAGLDIDKQIEIINRKVDFEALKDPEEVEKLVTRFIALSDALSGVATANSGALQMLTASATGNFNYAVLDIESVVSSGFSGYKTRL
ncbi:hypothetical protein ATO6_20385 [Oceanicola sp. 22II-s10i]|uniref:DUF1217 domain-containing protein n=1 Tax=Oceanicola sp. 22II-s10i TaxID=1317116 RepID=UPI000B528577|nr:DUF1217 domain-containing protein [Oceanicola sp. 22II-s10i]OWU83199.1 hypothetical protein ATO6_20385 [Oceanicola sp. 22II-s10i]